MKLKLIFAFILLSNLKVSAQTLKADTVKKLDDIVIKGYHHPQAILRAVSAVSLIDSNQLKHQPSASLLSALNTIAGLRMEERSPGSYRLSLRGSLLRSPFGIRNIKIYIDDFPLTDAGGNTYLNALDFSAIGSMEIYKGPEASIFGANTGGAILIQTAAINKNSVNLSLEGGSYGLFRQSAKIQQQFKNYRFSITEGYQRSDGYRENSAMDRKYIQTNHQWNYAANGNLKLFAFYSDLKYKTPGGLTLAQVELNPKLARPATATLPGAITQQAGIFNKSIFGGLSNQYQLHKNFKHVIAFYTAYTDFKNPFITNYEKRLESTIGLRTFIEYQGKKNDITVQSQLGVESAKTKTNIKNFDNYLGNPTNLQAFDDLKANQSFGFFRMNFDFNNKLSIELASSLNFYQYHYESFFPQLIMNQQKNFKNQLMPKIASSYLISQELSIRASISKGYSPPTIAEVRASDNQINTNLQAEQGWNYEAGLKFKGKNNRFYANANVFNFQLKNAIVRRLNQNDTEYFINAGGTNQSGLELESSLWVIKNENAFLKGLQMRSNYTYNHFRFKDFESGNLTYNGNKITGIPAQVLVSNVLLEFGNTYLFAQHNYTASIPLNDANTTYAKSYHLIELKTGLNNIKIGKTKLEIYLGANNLLNEHYSLGNDLNAVGARYYNPAMGTNFYGGLVIEL